MQMPVKCDRCRASLKNVTLSKFNGDIMCDPCTDKEHNHPQFSFAEQIFLAMSKFDSAFKGIGKPADL
jgi:hypothetical protein